MLYSNDARVQILKSSGFYLARRCFEREFTKNDLKSISFSNKDIKKYTRKDKQYVDACKLLYKTYVKNHESINPLTVGVEEFSKNLPNTVFCVKDEINRGFAFVEKNEICYVSGNGNLENFFGCVLNKIFSKYQSVLFEADDVDMPAMTLKNMFNDACTDSFDTYIFS